MWSVNFCDFWTFPQLLYITIHLKDKLIKLHKGAEAAYRLTAVVVSELGCHHVQPGWCILHSRRGSLLFTQRVQMPRCFVVCIPEPELQVHYCLISSAGSIGSVYKLYDTDIQSKCSLNRKGGSFRIQQSSGAHVSDLWLWYVWHRAWRFCWQQEPGQEEGQGKDPKKCKTYRLKLRQCHNRKQFLIALSLNLYLKLTGRDQQDGWHNWWQEIQMNCGQELGHKLG